VVKLSRIDGMRFNLIRFDELGSDCNNPPIGTAGCGPPLIPWNNPETTVTAYRDGVPVFSMTIPEDDGTQGTVTYVLNWENLVHVIWDLAGNDWVGNGTITVIDNIEVEQTPPTLIPALGPWVLGIVAILLLLTAAIRRVPHAAGARRL
jgi:hypothetical protein